MTSPTKTLFALVAVSTSFACGVPPRPHRLPAAWLNGTWLGAAASTPTPPAPGP